MLDACVKRRQTAAIRTGAIQPFKSRMRNLMWYRAGMAHLRLGSFRYGLHKPMAVALSGGPTKAVRASSVPVAVLWLDYAIPILEWLHALARRKTGHHHSSPKKPFPHLVVCDTPTVAHSALLCAREATFAPPPLMVFARVANLLSPGIPSNLVDHEPNGPQRSMEGVKSLPVNAGNAVAEEVVDLEAARPPYIHVRSSPWPSAPPRTSID